MKMTTNNLRQLHENINSYLGQVEATFNTTHELANEYADGQFILAYFDARRTNNFSVPKSIEKI
ncbi:hypothetical protein ACFCP7_24535, partial [Paenibacillus elgii]